MSGEAPLIYKDTNGDKLSVKSGGIVNFETGAKLQNAGVDMDLSAGIATATAAITAELDTLAGVTPGTVAASKAVVVDANKDATGARNITATGTVQAATAKVTTALVFENGASDIALTAAGANLVITNLPTVDPEVSGALWNDSGVLSISAG